VLAALLRARVPTPSFVKLAAPETSPLKVSVLPFTVTVLFPGRATAPVMDIELVPAKVRSDVNVRTLVAVNAEAEASRVPPFTVIAPVPAAAALPNLKVPLDTVSPPVKVFAPERVNVPVLLTEPAPEMIPEEVPPAMVAVFVVAIARAPPVKLVIVESAAALNVPPDMVVTVAAPVEVKVPLESVATFEVPRAFKVPPLIVVTEAAPVEVKVPAERVATFAAPLTLVIPPEILAAVVCPRVPAVTAPLEIALFNAPVTVTVPAEIPLVIVASLENAVVPAPERVVTVVAADVPVKFTLPALLTEATVRPVPETLAVALAATVSEAAELKSAAFKVPPLTVMPEVFTRDPAEVVRVPAVTVVVPE